MKSYVVIGLGNFGRNVALELASYGEEVLAVDKNEKRVEELKDQVTACVIADAREKEALVDFVSADMEAAILNLGDNLEAIALTTLNLVDLGVKRIIVKAETPAIGKIVKAIGATEWINPEQEGARHLARKLHQPNLIEHIPLAPDYDIVEVAVPDPFIGRSLGTEVFEAKGLIHALIEGPGTQFAFMPEHPLAPQLPVLGGHTYAIDPEHPVEEGPHARHTEAQHDPDQRRARIALIEQRVSGRPEAEQRQ